MRQDGSSNQRHGCGRRRRGLSALLSTKVFGEGEYFLEVTVQLCGPSAEVDIESIEGALPLLRELRSRGYSMECREGSVTCECLLAASELGAELELVSAATHDLK